MEQSITIQSINYSGELVNILFKPDISETVYNLGNQTLPYIFSSNTISSELEIFGSYTMLILSNNCPYFLNVPRITPTPTPTVTPTRTQTPTPTPTVTPTPSYNPCNVPTPTPTVTPTSSPLPEPPGIYFGKFSGTTITSGDVSNLTFVITNDPTNDYLTFPLGVSPEYGYVLIPDYMSQPSAFYNSTLGCNGFVIPTNMIGTIFIIDGNGFPINYNIYRTYNAFTGLVNSWLCS
jgi:hypothetical protein